MFLKRWLRVDTVQIILFKCISYKTVDFRLIVCYTKHNNIIDILASFITGNTPSATDIIIKYFATWFSK